jgi:hypothetical protein
MLQLTSLHPVFLFGKKIKKKVTAAPVKSRTVPLLFCTRNQIMLKVPQLGIITNLEATSTPRDRSPVPPKGRKVVVLDESH